MTYSNRFTRVALNALTIMWILTGASAPQCTGSEPAAKPTTPSGRNPLEWDFEAESSTMGELIGPATISGSGPTNELFQGQPESNQALEFLKPGGYLRLADEPGHQLDFGQDDPITIEAWVRIDSIAGGSYPYIVSKGRTYETKPLENHNYALRLAGFGNTAKISFLFSTEKPDGSLQYHRWTSTKGFAADGMWHHVAVSYQFGLPKSISGYVDGEKSTGKWDMAGATTLPPVVDDDSLWIGSSRGGAAGNSLVGAVDNVRIHHAIVAPDVIARRRVVEPYIPTWPATADESQITLVLSEGVTSHTTFPLRVPAESFRFSTPRLALHRLPLKVSAGGIRQSWDGPVLVQAFAAVELPKGNVELLMRSPGRSRLWIDGQVVMETPARKLYASAHQPFVVYEPDLPWLRVPHVGDREERAIFYSDGKRHKVVLETLVGATESRCEVGETLVAARTGEGMFVLLGPGEWDGSSNRAVHLVDAEFVAYRSELEEKLSQLDRQLLEEESAKEDEFWNERHRKAVAAMEATWAAAPLSEKFKQQTTDPYHDVIDQLVESELSRETLQAVNHRTSDLEFLRRICLDTVGVPPSLQEIQQFLSDPIDSRRELAIDRLLSDDRWADHWTGYWQDVLAENPSILKPSLNNTGPFRMWIHDSLVMNKPMDRFVTELIRMEGGTYAGAAAGFEMASQNDVPMAEKAHVVASAFLAMDMKCARCHDAPYHPWKQRDLFSIGAMLGRKPITVPVTSSVPLEFFDRKNGDSPIEVTLKPGEQVDPRWPLAQMPIDEFGAADVDKSLLGPAGDSREQLSALITRGDNRRFVQTMVNRLWTRMLGWGFMTETDDWYEAESRHAAVLEYLSREFVRSGYDMKALARLIAQSDIYQRRAIDRSAVRGEQAYSAPWRRRLSAEQVVDSLHAVTGVEMATEPITFDPEASQKIQNFLNLGVANRAWQLASLSNERDRPSLSLPKAAAVVECLEAFGWRSSRQSPLTHRDAEANVVQPGVVSNGHVTTWVTRLTDDSATTQLALEAESADEFVQQLFMSMLTREPTPSEQAAFVAQLEPGFDDRKSDVRPTEPEPPRSRGFATWTNHFAVEANMLMREIEQEVASGPKATERLEIDWRQRAEDAAWALLNAPEFQLVP